MTTISGNNTDTSSSTYLVVNHSDLLIQIILRLPVTSLLVFKAVSKHWYSLITDSYFMQKHYALNKNNLSVSGLFFPKHDEKHYDVLLLDHEAKVRNNISFVIQVNEQQPVDLLIEQSCNGLLLCCGPYPCSHTGTRYVYNPSTRHYRTIPPPPQFQKEHSWADSFKFQFYLAFNPQKSANYEIVCIWSTDHTIHTYKIAIYSSETCSWRLINFIFYTPSYRGFYWNGCLNWIKSSIHTLVYFDIAQQVLKWSLFSVEMNKYSSTREYCGECMGHLYLILRDKASTSNCFNVFEMEIDYSGWKPICRVDLGELANQYGSGASMYCLYYRILKVFVEGDGDEDELKSLILLPYEIISYNLKKESFTKICDYPVDQYVHYSQHDYIGSFASV